MRASGVPRADIFLVTKTGPYLALGYDDTRAQFANFLNVTGAGYADLLLVHWPDCLPAASCAEANSSEPACVYGSAAYDAKACRLRTWAAMADIFVAGGARAIGVSNYNATHLQEIKDAGLPLPAVNQIPFHPYHSSVQAGTIAWCAANGVLVNGYSPFGVVDRKTFPPPMPALTPLADPVVVQIAAAHGVTPATVILAWQYQLGIVFNPRSQNAAHMLENIGATAAPWWSIALTAAEMSALSSRPQA